MGWCFDTVEPPTRPDPYPYFTHVPSDVAKRLTQELLYRKSSSSSKPMREPRPMMLDREYGTDTLDDLAALVVHARPDKAPTWQVPGVRAALIRAARRPETITLAQLASAALTVAADPSARTPEPICWDGPWWSKTHAPAKTPDPLTADWWARCATCGHPESFHPIDNDIHHFESNADHAKAAQSTDHQAHAAEIRAKIGRPA